MNSFINRCLGVWRMFQGSVGHGFFSVPTQPFLIWQGGKPISPCLNLRSGASKLPRIIRMGSSTYKNVRFLVLASDGLWDVISTAEVRGMPWKAVVGGPGLTRLNMGWKMGPQISAGWNGKNGEKSMYLRTSDYNSTYKLVTVPTGCVVLGVLSVWDTGDLEHSGCFFSESITEGFDAPEPGMKGIW